MTTSLTAIAASRRALVGLGGGLLAAGATSWSARGATPAQVPVDPGDRKPGTQTHYRTVSLDGLEIFYREAGPSGAPVVLLLHGFPTSSRMFNDLVPMLADKYRVIAPDYPAFGHSAVPPRSAFAYTHSRLSEVVDALLDKLEVGRFAMYVMDYGGPIGYRLLLKYPDRVWAVVIQNAPAFGNPTNGPLWAPVVAYWKDGSPAHRQAVRYKLTVESIRNGYLAGTRDPSLIDPDTWLVDAALIARPGVDEIMLDLIYDIRNNRPVIVEAQRYFGAHQHQVMIATGANDPLFPGDVIRPPAEMANLEFHGIDSGHFALADRWVEVGDLTRRFLARVMPA